MKNLFVILLLTFFVVQTQASETLTLKYTCTSNAANENARSREPFNQIKIFYPEVKKTVREATLYISTFNSELDTLVKGTLTLGQDRSFSILTTHYTIQSSTPAPNGGIFSMVVRSLSTNEPFQFNCWCADKNRRGC